MLPVRMGQISFFSPEAEASLSVAELTRRVRERLESDPGLQDVLVTGEVSNVSRPQSGHLYFTLKDDRASLRCVMWKSQVRRLRFPPRGGDMVEVHGNISVYDAGGQYQLYADAIRPAGQGLLFQQFLRLKAALEAEGLFDPGRKRPLPAWPARIGIVTSPTGAALQDMLNTIRRRFPLAEVILAPSLVQGTEAPPGIIRSLRRLRGEVRPDVILLARGGGSMEDLWAFNDEGVVRAVAASEIPVVSGVGHETDFTLADFAADLRAPTPTAAAELATPDRAELLQGLSETKRHLARLLEAFTTDRRWGLNDLASRLALGSPDSRVRNDLQKLDDRSSRFSRAAEHRLDLLRLHLDTTRARLQAGNPLAVLQRGYAIVTDAQGEPVSSAAAVNTGDDIRVRLRDGTLEARVTGKGSHP